MPSTIEGPDPVRPAPPRPRRRLWRTGLIVTSLTGFALLIAGGCALTCRPAWFATQAVDFARLPDDKRALVSIVDGIGAGLQTAEPLTVELTADQVNRWLVARRELSPEEWLDAKLPDLDRLPSLQVSFLSGNRVRLAILAEQAGFGTVVSVVLHVEADPDELRTRIVGVRMGLLPVPRSWVLAALRSAGGEAAAVADADGSWRAPNDFVWPNGKRRFRVDEIATSDNRVRLRLSRAGDGP